MLDEKKWYMSKSLWGAAVMIAATVVGIIRGKSIDPAVVSDANLWIEQAIALVGAALAIYGRVTAKDTLTK